MNYYVTVDENWAIGNKGALLVNIPADNRLMRQETAGKIVVMGRKTLESMPQGQPLGGRINIILSQNKDLIIKDAIVAHSREELLDILAGYDDDDVYVIGGTSVYKMLFDLVDTIHVTKIDHAYDADVFFENLDDSDEWILTADSDEQYYFDLTYNFLRYSRVKG